MFNRGLLGSVQVVEILKMYLNRFADVERGRFSSSRGQGIQTGNGIFVQTNTSLSFHGLLLATIDDRDHNCDYYYRAQDGCVNIQNMPTLIWLCRLAAVNALL